MASTVPFTGSDFPADDSGDLFNYSLDVENIFRDVDTNMDAPTKKQISRADTKDPGPELGIDEEIKLVRKRQPVPKLDEDRLLSQAGIPKLRRIAKERFQFKGKGHEVEYRDLARLLNIYQLWLDDLYPRAKFADGLEMIEKLGHRKRIQIMRREWIDEGKLRRQYNDMNAPQEAKRIVNAMASPEKRDTATGQDMTFETSFIQTPSDEDHHAASPRRVTEAPNVEIETLFLPNNDMDDQPPEDDLDALLAETRSDHNGSSLTAPSTLPRRQMDQPLSREDDFYDDMEAMAEMDEIW
ncbi:MAG: hypothetical protein Q9166_004629 [cf. Caloplaca sp. 2 TL-2023]